MTISTAKVVQQSPFHQILQNIFFSDPCENIYQTGERV